MNPSIPTLPFRFLSAMLLCVLFIARWHPKNTTTAPRSVLPASAALRRSDTPHSCALELESVCALRELPQLRSALTQMPQNPRSTLLLLRSLQSPIAHAWAVYASVLLRERPILEQELARLDGEMREFDAREPRHSYNYREAFERIRWHADRLASQEELYALVTPCWMFHQHGRVALQAFSPLRGNGTNRDAIAHRLKERCITARLSTATRENLEHAVHALRRGMFRVVPRPSSELWNAAVYTAEEELYDAVLAPIETAPQGTDAALDAVTPAHLRTEVADFRRVQNQEEPLLARAICESAVLYWQPSSPAECAARAHAASNAMLHSWMATFR